MIYNQMQGPLPNKNRFQSQANQKKYPLSNFSSSSP